MRNPEHWLTNTQGPEPGSDQSLEGFLEEEGPGHGDDSMPRPLREMGEAREHVPSWQGP